MRARAAPASASASSRAASERIASAAAGVERELALRQPQRERERDEPLLRAVVQVPLEPPPLGVAGLDEPHARAAELGLVPRALADVEARQEQPRVALRHLDLRERPLDHDLAAAVAAAIGARAGRDRRRAMSRRDGSAVARGDEHVGEQTAAHPLVVDDPRRAHDRFVEANDPSFEVEDAEERR